MNEAWKKHIQPILDSWQWDHFSWVWDPFYTKYPKFSEEQKEQVDHALATCAFDESNEKSAIKALGIAGFLQNNHLVSQRLSDLIKDGLREKITSLEVDSVLTIDYVIACKFFGIKEAIPYLQRLVLQIEERKANGSLDEKPFPKSHTYREMLEKYISIIQDLLHDP